MKKIILCLFIIALAYAAEWETGVDNTIHWEGEPVHELHSSDRVPRGVDVQVSFQKHFSKIPKVLITHQVADYQTQQPTSYKCFVKSVTTKSFVYRCQANNAKQYYTFQTLWFAVLDSKIQFQYLEVATNQLATGARKADGTVQYNQQVDVTWDYPFESAPNVAAFLLGADMIDGDFSILATVRGATPEGAKLKVSTTTAHINWAYVVVVAAAKDFSLVDSVGSNVGREGDVWNTPDGSARSNDCTSIADVPEEFTNLNKGVIIQGLSGYDANKDDNLRVSVGDVSVEDNTFNCKLYTWAYSVTYAIYVQVFMYAPQEDCAILYTECNYGGDKLEICAGSPVNSFQQQKFVGKNVKSIKVPHGRTLTLYDQENQNGDYIVVEKDQTCIESWQWTKAAKFL